MNESPGARGRLPRILLAHPPEVRVAWYGSHALAQLRLMGAVVLHERRENLVGDRLVEAAQGCEVMVADGMTPGPEELFSRVSSLVAFVRCATDIRNVDVRAASAHGVLVTRTSPIWVDAVCELVLGLMLSVARGIPDAVAAYRSGREPSQSVGVQLADKTVGIIGYGNLGRRLAEVARAFGMRVLVSDPYAPEPSPPVQKMDLAILLAEADFVVCLAAYTDETENLMNADAFARMKPDAFFINASRGAIVDEKALRDVLVSGQIAGAGLDVGRAFNNLPNMELARLPNVVATPHIGAYVPNVVTGLAAETVVQVKTVLRGEMPEGAVNPEHSTRLSQVFPIRG